MTKKMFERYKPHSKQKDFHASEARFKNLCAGVRSGKTFAAGREFVKQIRQDAENKPKRNFLYWAVAPDHVIGQTQIEEVFKVLTEPFGIHFEDIRKSPLVRYWNDNKKVLSLKFKVKLKNGKTVTKYARIRFRSAERPESLVADTVDGAWIDEAARLKPAAWPNVRARLVTTRGWCLFSTTPFGRNWYYHEIYTLGDPSSDNYNEQFENFVFYTSDNTAVPGIKEEVELARKQMPEKFFKRDFEASFDTFVGQIYDDFDRTKHLMKRKTMEEYIRTGRIRTFILGKDWGYTNPGTSIVVGVDDDLNFYIIDAIYKTQVNVDSSNPNENTWVKMDQQLFKKYPIQIIYADPARADNVDVYRRKRFPIRSADNSVMAGIQTVMTMLKVDEETGKTRLYVCEDLKHVIEEFQAYKWAEQKDGNLKEEPDKKNDHAMDAIRYAIFNYLKTYKPKNIKSAINRNEGGGDW